MAPKEARKRGGRCGSHRKADPNWVEQKKERDARKQATATTVAVASPAWASNVATTPPDHKRAKLDQELCVPKEHEGGLLHVEAGLVHQLAPSSGKDGKPTSWGFQSFIIRRDKFEEGKFFLKSETDAVVPGSRFLARALWNGPNFGFEDGKPFRPGYWKILTLVHKYK